MAITLCPFCGYKAEGEYAAQLHIEEHHTEDSPWMVNNSAPDSPRVKAKARDVSYTDSSDSEDNGGWIKCTRPNCGNYFSLADMNDHYELHEEEERIDAEERPKSASNKRARPVSSASKSAQSSPRKRDRPRYAESTASSRSHSLLEYFSGSSTVGRQPPKQRKIREPRAPGRLGKRELGPHAFEDQMPEDVRRRLIRDAEPHYTNRIGRDGKMYQHASIENETAGIIPVLAELCDLDRKTAATYFCDPSVRHVVKIRCDGNFCGFWNIQMLLSYLDAQRPPKNGTLRRLPNVLEIQDTIERAWDSGVCSYGRIETGGIRNTRKWIGSHEALAYFTQVGVDVETCAFREDDEFNSQPAVFALLDHVEAYFMSGIETAKHHGTSHITTLPPIYFQRFGHSMTIVGLERRTDGHRNLLVFDPSYATAAPMGRLLAGRKAHSHPEQVLRAYRRSDVALGRWDEFEIIVPKTQPPKAYG